MTRALVTGATGMLGSHLVERLLKAGVAVRALVRPTSDTHYLRTLPVEIVTAGATDRVAIHQAVAGSDWVFHLASGFDVGAAFRTGEGLEKYHEVDVHLTEALLRASQEASVRRLVYASSVSVYSVNAVLPIAESAPLDPASDYGRSKLAAESRVRAHQQQGLPTVIVRPGITYGPRDRHFLPGALRLARLPLLPLVDGGSHLIDVVYVGDVVELMWSASRSPLAVGKVYNAASGSPRPLRELWEDYRQLTGRAPRICAMSATAFERFARLTRRYWGRFVPGLESLLSPVGVSYMGRDVYYDVSRACADLNYAPQVTFKQGVALSLAEVSKIAAA
jgi:2-alkyl-3-oxoalkanoate reductase